MILLYLGFLRRFYSVSNYSPKYEDQHILCGPPHPEVWVI